MTGQKQIGFAGLSHLGIIYSTAALARGFAVIAYDSRPGWAGRIDAGELPVSEPGLVEVLAQHRSQISFTDRMERLASCDLIFIALDVATDEENNSDLQPLRELLGSIAVAVQPGTTLVLMSQVPPGFCRQLLAELPPGIRLFYQVETLVFGDAVERAIHPERYMIGCRDPKEERPAAYQQFLAAFQCPLLPMRYESAEICKIAINCFLVSSVVTANTLAELCGPTKADWSEVVPALRLDRRIGPYAYLKPGLGIAGGNLERDLMTVRRLAGQHGTDARVVAAWQQNSGYARDWVLRRLFALRLLETHANVLGIWWVAYKPDTHSTKNSPSLALLRSLAPHPCQAFDPAAKVDAAFSHVRTCDSALDAARGAAALVVMTPWKAFGEVPLARLREVMAGRHVLDPYGALDHECCVAMGFEHHILGI